MKKVWILEYGGPAGEFRVYDGEKGAVSAAKIMIEGYGEIEWDYSGKPGGPHVWVVPGTNLSIEVYSKELRS